MTAWRVPAPRSRAGGLRRAWGGTPLSFRIGGVLLLVHFFLAVAGPWIAPYGVAEIGTGPPLAGAGFAHPFGTDLLGRDIFSRVLHGAHVVLLLSLSGTLLGLGAGAALGLLSAYLGGLFDEIAMRIVEALISIPYIVLALLAVTVAGPRLSGEAALVALVVAFVFAPRIARMARAAALDVIRRDFVTVARLRGDPAWLVAWRELLPNVTGTLLVEFALRAAYAPVLVGSLGFLGFGMRPPSPEWGLMISENRDMLMLAPITVLGPALMLASLVIALNLWTEGLARILGRSVRPAEA